jgi:competence protein ComEC
VSSARAAAPRSAWLATGAAAAAAAATLGIPAIAALIAGPATIAIALALRGTRRAAWHPRGVALGTGVLLLAVRLIAGPAGAVPATLPDGLTGPWTATVESVGSPRDGHQTARLRLELDDREVTVAATLPAYPEVRAGVEIVVDGRLRPPPPDDPYGEYLVRSGAGGTLQARSVRVAGAPSSVTLQNVRDGAGDALQAALPEPEAGLAAGILIGLRERVDRQLAADFATAGVSHVVAISGWNIAIVAGLVGALLRGRPKRLVAVVVGGTIVAYVVAAGASPSVVRAAVMAAVVLLARETGRAGRATAALAWAAAILLVVDPRMIGDAGFRLSVLATAGLLAWANPLAARIRGMSGGRVPGWLAESLGISLAAQAATLPDVVATFGRLSLVAPVVNLAVVPLIPLAMAGGVVALAGGALAALGAPSVVATLAGLPGWLLLHVIVAMVRIGATIPFAAVDVPAGIALPFAGTIALVIALVPVVRRGWRRRRRTTTGTRSSPARSPVSGGPVRGVVRGPRLEAPQHVLLIGLVLLIGIGSAAVANAAGRETSLTVLDVGQGDAILVESRSGARMLVDGGPDPDRLLLELDARIPPWDRRIDIIVLTHPHEDHVAGLVRVLSRYTVGRVYEPGMRGPGPGWAAWDKALRDGPPRGQLATGTRIALGEIRLTVLWPDPGTVPLEPATTGTGINNVSIVLLGEAEGHRFLLTGDIEEEVDPTLVARGLPHVDVLKVAHHGSATATTQAFLDAVRPAVAAISVGTANPYGHPAHATTSRLAASGARVLRTDLDGSIEADFRPDGVIVRTTGGRTTAAVGTWSPAVRAASLGYDPYHDRPDASPGRPPASLARSARMARAAFVRRRGRRRLARHTRPLERSGRGRGAGRRRGAAARRGQAALGRGARPPPPRRRFRLVACRPGLAGARPARARPPGRSSRGAGACHLVADGEPRGPDCGLRRQACRPASRIDGRALCVVATPVSRRADGSLRRRRDVRIRLG